jgi:hypothetical protein
VCFFWGGGGGGVKFLFFAKWQIVHRKVVLAKFDYKLYMEIKILKHCSMFLTTLLEPFVEIWRPLLNFGWILDFEKSQKSTYF